MEENLADLLEIRQEFWRNFELIIISQYEIIGGDGQTAQIVL